MINYIDRYWTFIFPRIRGSAVSLRAIGREALGCEDSVVGKQHPGFLIGSNGFVGGGRPRIRDWIINGALGACESPDH
jgi:hypothetical protein